MKGYLLFRKDTLNSFASGSREYEKSYNFKSLPFWKEKKSDTVIGV
jgi:hypothetical protein